LLLGTWISETISFYAARRWHNSLPVSHVYSPLEFLLLSLYFNYSIEYFRKRNLGLIIGLAGIPVSVLNTLLFQPLLTINSNFLLFEGTVVIIYCLILFGSLLKEDHMPYRHVSFWMAMFNLILWSSTFTGWGMYEFLREDDIIMRYFDPILTTANFVFYLGIGATLAFYKKLIPSGCE
jgi:hypothetical protein